MEKIDFNLTKDEKDKFFDVEGGGEKGGSENEKDPNVLPVKLYLNSAYHASTSLAVAERSRSTGAEDAQWKMDDEEQALSESKVDDGAGNDDDNREDDVDDAMSPQPPDKLLKGTGNHQGRVGSVNCIEKEDDSYECSSCALIFTSRIFLKLHVNKCHKDNNNASKEDDDESRNSVVKGRKRKRFKQEVAVRRKETVNKADEAMRENRVECSVEGSGHHRSASGIRLRKFVTLKQEGDFIETGDDGEEDTGNGIEVRSENDVVKSHSFNLRKRKKKQISSSPRSSGGAVHQRRSLAVPHNSCSSSTSPREHTILCDVCYEKFHCDELKHWHMQINLKEEKVMKCDGCGEVFNQNSIMYTHTSQAYVNNNRNNKHIYEKQSNSRQNRAGLATKKKEVGNSDSLVTNGEKKPIVCNFCGKSFAKKRDYQRHERIHTGEKPYVCGVCDKAFSDGGSFNKHKRIHTGEKPFRCVICDKAFNRKWDVNRHMSVHTGSKPFPCHICGKSFSRKYEQDKHIKFHAEGSSDVEDLPSFVCPICRKMYRERSDLQTHLKSHTDDKPFQCTFCERAFIIRRDLQRHVRSHTGEKPYVCNVCGKAFRDTSACAHHKKIHSGFRPFTCSHCGKGFIKKDDLKRHMRVHTGERPYVCSYCGKAFSKNHDLKRHNRTHTGERPYKCSICDKAFMRTSNLLTHMNIHTGAKPFKCHLCTRAFKGSGDLYRHIKSHEKEKTHKCSMCPQSFARSLDLDRHTESHFGQRVLSDDNNIPGGTNGLASINPVISEVKKSENGLLKLRSDKEYNSPITGTSNDLSSTKIKIPHDLLYLTGQQDYNHLNAVGKLLRSSFISDSGETNLIVPHELREDDHIGLRSDDSRGDCLTNVDDNTDIRSNSNASREKCSISSSNTSAIHQKIDNPFSRNIYSDIAEIMETCRSSNSNFECNSTVDDVRNSHRESDSTSTTTTTTTTAKLLNENTVDVDRALSGSYDIHCSYNGSYGSNSSSNQDNNNNVNDIDIRQINSTNPFTNPNPFMNNI